MVGFFLISIGNDMMVNVYMYIMKVNKPIFVITGPSASGKTTIAMEVVKSDLPITKIVTTTTRVPREGEIDGIDYHFVAKAHFEEMIERDEMFEWARYNDNYYGSQKRTVNAIFDSRKYPLWTVEIQGAEYFKKHYPMAKIFFIMPESLDILRKRLAERGSNEKEITSRLRIAKAEMAKANLFDYQIINREGKLTEAVLAVVKLVREVIAD